MIYQINERYQIRPYSNGLCWEIFEYRTVQKRTGETVTDWVSVGKYPQTLQHGLQIIYEMALKAGDCIAKYLPAVIKHCEKIYKDIKKGIKENG